MEHSHVNPNKSTEPSESQCVESPQDEGEADTIGAGSPETPESLLSELEDSNNVETTELENSKNVETTELENNNNVETKTEGKNKYPCKFCPKVFDKHQALGGHMNGHSKDMRNLEKFGKFETWMREAYPGVVNISEALMQGTPTNRASCSSYSRPRETNGWNSQQGQPWTAQQSSQQTQSIQGLPTQQRQGLQNFQAQGPRSYQAPQGAQSSQAPQGAHNYQAPQGHHNYQAQGPQSSQAPQGSQNYQAQRPQSYQAPQGPIRQLSSDFNNQQRNNINPNMSNGPTAPARVPCNEHSSYAKNPHPQQGARVPMPYPNNMHAGYRPTTSVRAPSNVQMNNAFYAQHAHGLGRGNQMIGTPHHGTAAQYRPGNSPNTCGSFNNPEVNDPMDEQWVRGIFNDHHIP